MCSSAPDTSGINAAARDNAQVGQQALDFYKQAYNDSAPDRAAASQRAGAVSDAQLAAMTEATREAKAASDFQDANLRPLQKGLVDEANNYDSEGKREELAGQAIGDVNAGFNAARGQAERDLTRRGVNVNDGSFAGTVKQVGLAQAAASVDAAQKARQHAETYGHALKADAAAALQGLPASAATQAGLALSSGNSSVGNAQVPVQLDNSGAALMGQGFSQAVSANNSAGNLYGTAAGIQQKSNDGMLTGLAGIGQAAGALGWEPFSDKNMKEKRKPVKTEAALACARKMPVDSWRYKKGSAGDDGGKSHIGPMAQDVHAAAGDAAAPDGKRIDLITMNGINLAAIQQLDKSNRKLEKKVASLSTAIHGKKRSAA